MYSTEGLNCGMAGFVWNIMHNRGRSTPEQGPLLEYAPYIKYAESWLFLYNIKNERYILPYNVSKYAL